MSFHLTAMAQLSDRLKGLRRSIETEHAAVLSANPTLRDAISNAFDAMEAHGQLATALAGGPIAEPATDEGGKKPAAK